ncbi:MAG: hypothetical protein HRU03_04520 [Nanoarchaeales archaeon]|nr:hypothetical protein [Nanoarchaeales archaeon]
MKKYFIWFLLFCTLISTSYSTNQTCIKPDEYILKCDFEPTLKERSFTCINKDCTDKLYTLSETLFLADLKSINDSIRILDGQINLNEIENNLELVQILCEREISPKLLEIFQKRVFQTKVKATQSFTGNFLTIEQETPYSTQRQTKFNCYNSEFETYLGWQIEIRTKQEYCDFIETTPACYKQKINLIGLLTESNEFNNLIKYSFVLITAILVGIVGLFTHLLETRKLKEFIKITKSKVIISIIISYPILYFFGRIIDLAFLTTFVTSSVMPALTFLIVILIIYLFASLLHYTHATHNSIKQHENKKELRKLIRKKRI